MGKPEPTVMMSLRVPRSLRRKFRIMCDSEEVKMTHVIIAMMKRFVVDEEFREEIVDIVRGNRGVLIDVEDPDREAQMVVEEVFGQ